MTKLILKDQLLSNSDLFRLRHSDKFCIDVDESHGESGHHHHEKHEDPETGHDYRQKSKPKLRKIMEAFSFSKLKNLSNMVNQKGHGG